MKRPFGTLCVVGAGTMGAQIALCSAIHGYTVWLVDTSQEALEGAGQRQAEECAERGIVPEEREAIFGRIHSTTRLQEGAPKADLVIEAIPERLDLKRAMFAQLDRLCPAHTILATNSSSLRVALIEDATQRPDKVLNIHFLTPVQESPMVELMGGTATSSETLEIGRRYALAAGLTPLMVRRQSTGFLFNRVWRAIKKECLRVVDQGIASLQDVDRAWMIHYNRPIGPFGQMDRIGLDVIRDIEMVYYNESGDPSDAPPRLLLDKIERGELGVKTGVGFYTYPDPAFEGADWLRGE